jgi:hypothetical protein
MTAVSGADPSVEVRLERIQAAVDVGNAQTKGQLDLLVLSHSHSEKLANERELRAAAELKERDQRLDKIEEAQEAQARKLWFLAGGASAIGIAANVGVQLLLAHR